MTRERRMEIMTLLADKEGNCPDDRRFQAGRDEIRKTEERSHQSKSCTKELGEDGGNKNCLEHWQ